MSSLGSPQLANISLQAGVERRECSSSTLVFFITGNPGLIGYYTTFLSTLQQLLQPTARNQSHHIHIYGQSLAGFSDDVTAGVDRPYGLEEQIRRLEKTLEHMASTCTGEGGKPYDQIILVGHSVGSYILLELTRRSRLSSLHVKITAGILLFPTITHIVQSPSGITISKLFRWRNAPRKLGNALQRVFSLIPAGLLGRLVALFTRMPTEFAHVTAGFLVSKIGIWQALHMARDEMETITEDRWDEDIWGAEGKDTDQKDTPPKLVFYFGQNDHWVAEHTRDTLITARGCADDANSTKPVMIIDRDKIPHGFCLKHGEIMAEKTKVWIENLLWSS